MKKTLLVAFAAFGMNAAIAQTNGSSSPSSNGNQTPGVQTNTPSQTTPGMQDGTTGSQTVNPGDHSNNTSGTNKQGGTKNSSGKNNSTSGSGTKNSSGTQNPNGTNSQNSNGMQGSGSATPPHKDK